MFFIPVILVCIIIRKIIEKDRYPKNGLLRFLYSNLWRSIMNDSVHILVLLSISNVMVIADIWSISLLFSFTTSLDMGKLKTWPQIQKPVFYLRLYVPVQMSLLYSLVLWVLQPFYYSLLLYASGWSSKSSVWLLCVFYLKGLDHQFLIFEGSRLSQNHRLLY